VVHDGGGGVGGVVPALERGDENGGAELRNLFDLDHAASL
jgi:hypothetical protein